LERGRRVENFLVEGSYKSYNWVEVENGEGMEGEEEEEEKGRGF
jgi:hypothetical protein